MLEYMTSADAALAANIEMAVRACREEQSELFKSKTQEDLKVVKESINDNYCDASGQALDLVHIGDMGGIKIYFSRGTHSCYLHICTAS